jgi:hypothetical protein
MFRTSIWLGAVLPLMLLACGPLAGGEIVRLSEGNYEQFAPKGKEVDAIYGDLVLRNGKLVVVIAHPTPTRQANMTVRGAGGMIIDLTSRGEPNDQLSAYYAGAEIGRFTDLKWMVVKVDGESVDPAKLDEPISGAKIEVRFVAAATAEKPEHVLRYELDDQANYVVVESTFTNPAKEGNGLKFNQADLIRADRTFQFGNDADTGLFWAEDDWFQQSYGVLADGFELVRPENKGNVIQLLSDKSNAVTLKPGESTVVSRKLFAARSRFALRSAAQLSKGIDAPRFGVLAKDSQGPVVHALAELLTEDGAVYGSERTKADGSVVSTPPPGNYTLRITAIGRKVNEFHFVHHSSSELEVTMEDCGYLAGKFVDESAGGKGMPCKVTLEGVEGTPTPKYGPESSDPAVLNVIYTHTGEFKHEIAPGKYRAIVSRGPEYDALYLEAEVKQGKTTLLEGRLKRVVSSPGWVSTDFHSHSTPSGDNTSTQRGRVLNLLCEQIEFAPCTEHNRIDSYTPVLKELGCESIMASCPGMELTGSLLPINHQNAFPLVHRPRTQDGGGPQIDQNPIKQIERLALWDSSAEKLVQANHPNLVQMLYDKDLDGNPDGGFNQMFGFMDVVEIHPPQWIFEKPEPAPPNKRGRNASFHWMQLLNLGYRIPGVVNTDAHYNHHGSGWLRNYVKSSQDDPAKIDTLEMVRASKKGNVVVSSAPYLEVLASKRSTPDKVAHPGEDLASGGEEVVLKVRVQCANWYDINRVQVFVNGRAQKELNFTRQSHTEYFHPETVRFEAEIPVKLSADAHLIVATIGEGLTLGPVFGETYGKFPPCAVANPIYVDVDGKGFAAYGDELDFPLPKDVAKPKK